MDSDLMKLGLPMSMVTQQVPDGLGGGFGAVQDAPYISGFDNAWNTLGNTLRAIEEGAETGIEAVYDKTKSVISHVYQDGRGAVSTVVSDVATPIETATKTTYMYLLVAVVVVAGALYFVGKGGALGQVRG